MPFLKFLYKDRSAPPVGRPSFRWFYGRRGKEVAMRRKLWHLLEVVVLYVVKRICDWLFDKSR